MDVLGNGKRDQSLRGWLPINIPEAWRNMSKISRSWWVKLKGIRRAVIELFSGRSSRRCQESGQAPRSAGADSGNANRQRRGRCPRGSEDMERGRKSQPDILGSKRRDNNTG